MSEHPKTARKLNLPELLARTENDRELMHELFCLFVDDFPRKCAQLKEAIDRADWPHATLVSHALKGMLSNLAAAGAASRAAQLEAVSREGNATQIRNAFRAFQNEVEGLLPEVQAQISEDAGANLDRG